jgi:hypothetical protein
MTPRATAAVSIVVSVVAAAGAAAGLGIANGSSDVWELFAFNLGIGCFSLVGALIFWRQPANPMGWLFAAVGILWVFGDLASRYATYGLVTKPGSLPAAGLAAWFGEWYWIAALMLIFSLIPLLFPTGRPLSPRWRIALLFVLGFTTVISALAMLEDRLFVQKLGYELENPIGIPGLHDIERVPVAPFLIGGAVAAVIIGATAIVVRFRRSRGEERQQLKWFTWAVVVLVVVFAGNGFIDEATGDRISALDGLAMALVPTAAAIAILRYRLYDIDVIVNKALVYASLTATLGFAYLALVVLLQRLVPGAQSSDLAVAISTLLVAALFRPARGRIQSFIDRRFYRAKYDAARTLEAFAARQREVVDLAALQVELLGVVRQTMQPVHASLWLKSPGGAQ